MSKKEESSKAAKFFYDLTERVEKFNAGTLKRDELTAADRKAIAEIAGMVEGYSGEATKERVVKEVRTFLNRVSAEQSVEGIPVAAIELAGYRRGLQKFGAEVIGNLKALQQQILEADEQRRAEHRQRLAAISYYAEQPVTKHLIAAYGELVDDKDLWWQREQLANLVGSTVSTLRGRTKNAPDLGAWTLSENFQAWRERENKKAA